MGAAALDAAVYEDVEADLGATAQAFIVVVLSSVAGGIGAIGITGSAVNIAFFSMVALLAWVGWALVTYTIGVHMFAEPQTSADVGELMRTIGFASTPGLLRVLGVMTPLAKPVFVLTAIWMLAAMVVAVRHALDFTSTARAVAVCVVGWLLAIAFAVAFGLMFAPSVA